RLLHGGRAGNPPANFIGKHAQIFLQGSGRLEGLLHNSIVGLRKTGHNTGQQQRRDEESNSGFAHGEGNYTQDRLPFTDFPTVTAQLARQEATAWCPRFASGFWMLTLAEKGPCWPTGHFQLTI